MASLACVVDGDATPPVDPGPVDVAEFVDNPEDRPADGVLPGVGEGVCGGPPSVGAIRVPPEGDLRAGVGWPIA